MATVKLFGASRSAAHVAPQKKKPGRGLRALIVVLTVIFCFEGLYFYCVFSNNAFIKKWRTIYINSAMTTMTHQWLATAFLPEGVVSEVRQEYGEAIAATIGKESVWDQGGSSTKKEETEPVDEEPEQEPEEDNTLTPEEEAALKEQEEREAFYELFWELDTDSMDAYVEAHPEVLENGWGKIHINEAGFEEEGIDVYTTMDEQVLGIDAETGVLLVRVTGSGYRGVLAIAKDPSRLTVEVSAGLGSYGETCGTIAEAHEGILAMNASAFWDEDAQGNQGAGNGGILAGYCMSNGSTYGTHYGSWGYKRIELHEDNRLYIKDAQSSVSEDCTDAVEFSPAMIVDGEQVIDYGYTGTHPRACIGQSDKYEILMLVIEGRQPLKGINGTDVNTCTEILLRHNCMQAMNLDGGSSGMIWFDGKYCISSSSAPLRYSGGRPLPNAWVYSGVASTSEE